MPKRKKKKYQRKKKPNKNKRKRQQQKKSSAPISATNLHKSSNNDFFGSKRQSTPSTIYTDNNNGVMTSDPSLIHSSERVNLDPNKPFGEHFTITRLNFPTAGSRSNDALEQQRQQNEYEKLLRQMKQDRLKKEKENRSSQHSDLNCLNNKYDSFWNLFPYKYRLNTSGQCNYYFIRGDYLHKVASARAKQGVSSFQSWELLKDLTLKEFRILIERNVPNAINEYAGLKHLFDNAQFGDAVDIDGYRGHGLYILGFGDLPFSQIENAYNTNNQKDYFKLLKTFDYDADHWYTLPMEFGDAPYNYYLNTALTGNNFRWVDPLRIAHKGVIWKKCIIDINKQKKDTKKKYIWINWGDNEEATLETKSSLLFLDKEAGINSYSNRYDEAIHSRIERFIKHLQTLCPLEDFMIESILSFCI